MSEEHTIHDGHVRNLRYKLHVAGAPHEPDIPAGSIVIELAAHNLEADTRSNSSKPYPYRKHASCATPWCRPSRKRKTARRASDLSR